MLSQYAECRYAECRGASWKAFPVSLAKPFRSKVGSLPPQKNIRLGSKGMAGTL
jgi:hypothetical protein